MNINIKADIANDPKEIQLTKCWGVWTIILIPEGTRKKNFQGIGIGNAEVARELAENLLAVAKALEAKK
jgi:hypothetical protein